MNALSAKRNILLVIVCIVSHATSTDGEGAEYTEDILIGRSQLFDNGPFWSRDNNDYSIMLLQVEGSTDRYNLGNGFFVGFQWYNDKYGQESDKINLQLYRLNWINSTLNEGQYILTHESGWINAQAGFNTFFFNEGIRFDTYDSVNDSYYMAIMMEKQGNAPVLFDMPSSCTGQTNVVLEALVVNQPAIGDSVYFAPDKASNEWCASYSIQGIFLPTNLAAYTHGSCSLYMAMKDEYSTVLSHTPYDSGFPSGNGGLPSVCQIIRAERPEYAIEIKTEEFELTSTSLTGDCLYETIILQIGDQKLLSDPNFNLWDSYCGNKIFGSADSSNPYVKLSLVTSSTVYGYKGYKFEVMSYEKSGSTLAIILGVTIPVAVIMICCVCICCVTVCNKNKKKKKVHGQSNQQSTQHSYNRNQPPNRLPPLTKTNQNTMSSNQYGNQYVSPTAPPSDPPPAYGSVFSQQPLYNQPTFGNDPYGVPPPAVYVEPTKGAPY